VRSSSRRRTTRGNDRPLGGAPRAWCATSASTAAAARPECAQTRHHPLVPPRGASEAAARRGPTPGAITRPRLLPSRPPHTHQPTARPTPLLACPASSRGRTTSPVPGHARGAMQASLQPNLQFRPDRLSDPPRLLPQGLRAQAQRGQGIRSGSVVVSSVGRQFGAAFTPCKQRAAERRRGLVPAQPTFRRCRAGFTVCCAASISPIGVGQCRTVLGSLANLMCARSTRPMRHGSARPPPLECVGFVNSLIQSRTRITVAGLRPVSLRLDRDSGLARERDRSEMSPRADKV
jgi:hypothetical protein